MDKTFFFYDLETSGLRAREDRIMQFAGQRTTLDLSYELVFSFDDYLSSSGGDGRYFGHSIRCVAQQS